MKHFYTEASVVIMAFAAIAGYFVGAFLNADMEGAILFSMIAGIACILYKLDNWEK